MTTLRQRLAQHLGHIARKITHPDRVQIEPPLRNPAALYVASDDVLVCADDERRAIFQVTLEKDGVTIRGKSLKLVDYPDVAAIESLAVCGQLVYFVSAEGPRTVGGLYSFNFFLAQKLSVLHPLKTFWPLLILELIRSKSMTQSTR